MGCEPGAQFGRFRFGQFAPPADFAKSFVNGVVVHHVTFELKTVYE
jgi:hypothetical protein